MKTLFLFVSFAILSFFSTNANNSMLFPQYKEGHAILGGGTRVATQFNYDKASQQMMFIDDEGRSMILVPTYVVAVVIDGRTFIPARDNNAFNERVQIDDKTLFVRHRVETRAHRRGGEGAAFGANLGNQYVPASGQGIVVAGSTNATVMMPGATADTYFRDNSTIFIHNGNRFVEINSLRNLTRQFDRAQRNQIEDFARNNNTSFRNVEDVKAITVYALSL